MYNEILKGKMIMKNFAKYICLFLAIVGINVNVVADTYSRIISTSQIEFDKEYLIVPANANYAMGAFTKAVNTQTAWEAVSVTVNGSGTSQTIEVDNASLVFKIVDGGIAADKQRYVFAQKVDGVTKYVNFTGTSNHNNSLVTSIAGDSKFELTVSSSAFQIACVGQGGRYLKYLGTNPGPCFTNLANGSGSWIWLFKKTATSTKYTVTLNDNGGTGGSGSVQVANGSPMPTPIKKPTKTGYQFQGYFDAASGGTCYYKNDGSSNRNFDKNANTTLYAHWVPATYTINYKDQGNTAFSGTHESGYPTKHTYNAQTTLKGATQTGYTFGGWYKDAACTDGPVTTIAANSITSSPTFYAKWTGTEYTIKLNRNSGDADGSVKATYGSHTLSNYTAVNRAGYQLLGYFTSSTKGSGYLVVTATGTLTDEAVTGWVDAEGNYCNLTASPQLHAQWEAATNTLTWNLDGGTVVTPGTAAGLVAYNAVITAPVVRKKGYVFLGWKDASDNTWDFSSTRHMPNANLTLTAQWRALTYSNYMTYCPRTVVFDKNGQDAATNWPATITNAKRGSLLTEPAAPSVAGASFLGWFKEDAGENAWDFENDVVGTGDVTTLYAKWSENSTDVTFDPNSGDLNSCPGFKNIPYGNDEAVCATLLRTGYTFDGYYTEGGEQIFAADGTMQTVAGYTESGWSYSGTELTLYAHWTPIEYTITYENTKGATNNNPTTYTVESNITFTALSSVTGYTFAGWSPATITAGTTGNKIVTASWTANQHSLTWDFAGGATTSEESAYTHGTVEYGASITAPADPTKTGYTFSAWSPEVAATMPDNNVTYTAQWTAITYQVSYNGNGNTGGSMSNTNFTYDKAGNLRSNGYTKNGYNFAGWALTAGGDVVYSDQQSVSNLATTQDAIVELFAKWTGKTINITWDAATNGGKIESAGTKVTSYTYDGANVELPTPDARTGYTFKGWFTSVGGNTQVTEVGTTRKPTTNQTYYAQWTVNDYTAKLDKNTTDGSGTDGSIKVTYDSRTVKAITHATRTGYTLTGYYSAASGVTLIVNADGTLSNNSHSSWLSSTEPHNWIHADNEGVLYARWSVNKYNVTLKANDGVTADRTSQFTYGAKTVGTFAGFTRTGYTLDGYYTAEAGGVMVLDANKKLVADVSGYTDAEGNWVRDTDPTITLWAHWTIITYNLNYYNVEGATNSNPATYNVTTPTFTLLDPVKTGHSFGGWYTAAGLGTLANTTIEQGSTGDKSFYAKWSVNDYSATLNANYTDGVNGSITVTYGTRTRKAYTGVTRDGWRLDGYYTTEVGGTMIVDAEGNLCDIKLAQWLDESHNWIRTNNTGVLYAHWTKTDYTLTCQTKTGSVLGCSTVEAVTAGTENVVVTLNESCIPIGYHLLEWECSLSSGFTTDVANRQITIATMPTKDVTVTAVLAPDLTVTGTVQLTSGQNIAVYAPAGTITISSTDMSIIESVRIKYYDKNDGDREYAGDPRSNSEFRLQTNDYTVGDGGSGNISVSTVYDGENSKTFSMVYRPNAAGELDHYQMKVELLVGQKVYDTKYLDVYGRSLPETFAIVMKNDGDKNWYALPNDLDASTSVGSSTKAPVVVMVDNQTTPTKVTFGPSNALYKTSDRYKSPDNNKGAIRFLRNGATENAWITTSATSQLYMPNNGAFNQNFNLTSSNFSDYLITQDGSDGYRISMYGGTIGWYNSGSNTKVYLLPVEAQLLPKEADIIEWGANGLVVEVDATNVAGMIATVGSESTSQLTMNQTMTSAGSATKYDYTFNLGALSLTDKADQVMLLQWKNSSDVVIGTTMVKVPRIINGNVVASEDAATKTAWTNYDKIVVLPGAKLTVDGGTGGFLNPTLKCVEVYPGGKLNIASGTVQTNTLILRAGWSSNKQWAMPNVAIANTATLTKTNAYLDWYVDYHQYYPIAVPFPVTVATMSYVNTNNSAASGVTFKQYDGQQRAEQGQASVGQNWKQITPTTLTPSTGYAMTARRPSGKAWSIVRMPLTFTNAWTTNGEQGAVDAVTKNVVGVTAYGVGGEQPWYCQGWNFVANPYMVPFNSNADGLTGKLAFQNGGGVKFATIPDINFEGYDQLPIASANLQPMSGFFVQVATTGNIEFVVDGKQPMAAPMLAAPAAEVTKGLSAEGYITISGNGQTDMFGLLVADEYTAGNDFNADLPKLLGDNKLRAYLVYNEQNMAYVAVNETLAAEWIPITVRVPQDGDYAFTLDEFISETDELEGLYLMDALLGTTTNLLNGGYSFEAEAGSLSDRFALNAVRRQPQTPTDISDGGGTAGGRDIRKVIYHDKLFIIVDGRVYDGTGKTVK